MPPKRLTKYDYTVAWICALPDPELRASRLLFDGDEHDDVHFDHDTINQYTYGEINGHNVVMGCLPATQTGKASAAAVASEMALAFPSIRFAVLVGIGGAVPAPKDIRLGDVVVSLPDQTSQHSGVVQYDFGKATHDGKFMKTGQINQPPRLLLSAVGKIQSTPGSRSRFPHYLELYRHDQYWQPTTEDHLFKANYVHRGRRTTCAECDLNKEAHREPRLTKPPFVHYGLIASGDQVVKDAVRRDSLSLQYGGILCFEMEAAGISNTLPTIVVRGISDYCDSHKNDSWQPFAAAAAAAWTKELLRNVAPIKMRVDDKQIERQGGAKGRDAWMAHFAGQLTRTQASVQDVEDLINRISSYEPRRILYRTYRLRTPGTCEWIDTQTSFVGWEHSDASKTLLISGKVGCGKTVAFAFAVDTLLSRFADTLDTAVVHYFFQRPSHKATDLFRSLSAQIVRRCAGQDLRLTTDLVHDLETFFRDCTRGPDLDEVVDVVFLPLVRSVDTLIICVDGLDGVSEREQSQTLNALEKITFERKLRQQLTKTLVTCESESKISRELQWGSFRINIDRGLVSDDIEKYIEARLQWRAREGQLFHETDLRDQIKRAILQQAGNMFLWVHFQLEEILCSCNTPADVRSVLQTLPQKLSDVYVRCLERAEGQGRLCNARVLQWCAAAKEPLGIDNLKDMLALDKQTGEIDYNKRPDTDYILRSSVSLLTFDELEQVLVPIHHSVRRFLFSGGALSSLRDDWQRFSSEKDAMLDIGHICLSHIKSKTGLHVAVRRRDYAVQLDPIVQTIPGPIQSMLGFRRHRALPFKLPARRQASPDNRSLLRYAFRGWALHTTELSTELMETWDIFKEVAVRPNASWRVHPWSAPGHTEVSHIRGLLGYAVTNNHLPLLQLAVNHPSDLLKRVFDEVLPGSDLLPALHVAAKLGHVDLLPMLLKRCSVNGKSPQDSRTALHFAASFGKTEFVRSICEVNGVYTDTRDAGGSSPLALAVENGHYETARCLLENGGAINIDSSDHADCTPLHRALKNEHVDEPLLSLLVGVYGADVGFQNKDGDTPLHIAAARRVEEYGIFESLLLGRRASLNIENNNGDTPLHILIRRDTDQVFAMCMEACDEDSHLPYDIRITLLHGAVSGLPENALRVLLDKVTDVHMHYQTRTLLHAAAEGGNDAAVGILLDKSANVNAQDKLSQTPLHLSAQQGSRATTIVLLDRGADPDLDDWRGRRALHRATEEKNYEVAEALLKGGADVDARDESGRTPLYFAVRDETYEMLILLLDNGADPNLWDESNRTPLHLAAKKGNHALAKALIDRGADVNSQDSAGKTPLHETCRHARAAIVSLLLDSGADMTAKDSHGLTAEESAADLKSRWKDRVRSGRENVDYSEKQRMQDIDAVIALLSERRQRQIIQD